MSIIELVNSLSVAEKRHFTLYTDIKGKGNTPKYIKLFALINKSVTITNTEIGEAGFKADDKTFLKEKIEESLHGLYLGKSVVSKLKWLTESMERYFNKQQWTDLSKCISKTKKIACKYEKYLDWLQAIYWEKEMLVAQPESKQRLEKIEKLIEEEQDVKGNFDEEMDYYNLRISLDSLLIKDIKLIDKENKKKFVRIISTKLLSEHAKPVSKKSKVNYYHVKTRTAYYEGEKQKSYTMAKKLVGVFENNRLFMDEHMDWYKKSICLLSGVCIFSGQVEEIPKLIKIVGNDDAHFKIACLHGLRYSIIKLDKDRGISYLKRIRTIIENPNHQIRPGRQLAIFYNGAVFCSFFGNWQEMHYWIEKIFNAKRTDDRHDIQYCARILNLINQFELQSDDMDNQIQATEKYFTRKDQYTRTNRHIIQAFRHLYRAINRKEMISIWNDLWQYLQPKVVNNNASTQQLGLGELFIWCTSKIENVSMGEVYKKS